MRVNRIIFVIIFLINTCIGYAQASDCSNATPVCSDATSEGVVRGFGIDDFYNEPNSGCLQAGGVNTTTVEQNSYWFRIKMAASGQFGFNIVPNDVSEDWDFAVYGPDDTCGAFTDPVRCNYRGARGYTGVGESPTGDNTAYDDWLDVTIGEEYYILVNQYDGDNAGFSIEFVGEIFTLNPEVLDCSVLVDLRGDKKECEGSTVTLNAALSGNYSYAWYVRDEVTMGYNLLPGETGGTLDVTVTGNYQVIVTDLDSGMVLGDDNVDVTFYTKPIAGDVSDLSNCDDDGDGIGTFDLNVQTAPIVNGQTNMTVSYYDNLAYAESGVGEIDTAYSGGEKTIYARLENDDFSRCFAIVEFDLLIVERSVAGEPEDIILCDVNPYNGKMFVNLEVLQTANILSGQVGIVDYYFSLADAEEPKGWIPDPTNVELETQTIWARYEPSRGSNCADIVEFEVIILETPLASQPQDIVQCDDNNDGYYDFDLNAMKDGEVLGGLAASTYEVNYFSSLFEAESNTNALVMPFTNVTPYAIETLYARIQNVGSSDCYDVTSFTIQVLDSAMPPEPGEVPELNYCDDDTDGDDTNGIIQFDLTERESILLNGQSPFIFDVTYFEDPTYVNPINDPTNFVNTFRDLQTIYVRVSNKTYNSCYTDTSFNVVVRPLPRTRLEPFDFYQCDEDGTPDGITNFKLLEAEPYITLGDATLNVTYHSSIADAHSGIAPVNKLSYSNGSTPEVYARMVSTLGCYRVVQINLRVSATAFPTGYLHQMVACDNDGSNDGFYEFNLTQATSEIIAQFPPNNLRVSFYRNENDAMLEDNAIDPAIAYVNENAVTQLIWVRVESADNGGCFGIGPIMELTVNRMPEFELEETGFLCLNNPPFVATTTNPSDNYLYNWFDDTGALIGQQPFVEINAGGTYSVIATSFSGCSSFAKQITVSESVIPDIGKEDISIIEDGDTFIVSVHDENQNLGVGDYEFALNDIDGPYQDNPDIYGVYPGVHTVYARDKNGCGVAMVEIHVLGFPDFFTPNNDGVNDYWNIRGIDFTVFSNAIIQIFDRYGKHIVTFDAHQPGWDGMYNDIQALSSDYWFTADLINANGTSTIYKGHFSLVRR